MTQGFLKAEKHSTVPSIRHPIESSLESWKRHCQEEITKKFAVVEGIMRSSITSD